MDIHAYGLILMELDDLRAQGELTRERYLELGQRAWPLASDAPGGRKALFTAAWDAGWFDALTRQMQGNSEAA